VRPQRIAAQLAERRRPKRLAAARRLAPRRAAFQPPAAAPAENPGGLSDFAVRWMFGDGVAEGTPFAGGAGADYDRPSFLEDAAEEPAAPATPGWERPAGARSHVEEIGPRFRLSRTPPATPLPEPAPPAEPATPAFAAPVPVPVPAPAAEADSGRFEGAGHRIGELPRATVRRRDVVVVHERPIVRVQHIHSGEQRPQQAGITHKHEDGRRRAGAVQTTHTAVEAVEAYRNVDRVKELAQLGERVVHAAKGEWSHLKHEAGEWKDRAEHEYRSLRRRAEGEAHHLERRAVGEVHKWEREGRHLERAAEKLPGQLEHRLEQGLVHAERTALRDVGRFIRRQPLVRAAEGLVHDAERGIKSVRQFEKRAEQAEKGLEKALKDPEKELLALGHKVEKEVLNRPVVRRAEAALEHAEQAARRDLGKLPAAARRDLSQVSKAADAAKAAALAAAAEVPLEISRAGRAIVNFEKEAAGAAHRLEAEARHALASADGHMPHVPHLPHVPSPSAIGAPAAAAERAAAAAGRGAEEAAHERMYEQVVDRLRRDLLAERERMGNLLGEWP
jgi:predicted subunit of tRNA(5-methylaminomethyl-2-thiouridylate) methyltransferase